MPSPSGPPGSPGRLLRRARLASCCALVAAAAGACCGWFRPVAGEPVDADCPAGSREVVAGGIRYCLLTCPGVLEDQVHCPPGLSGVRDFDGARVCAIQHLEHGIVQRQAVPDPLPQAVCRRLPHGCTCSAKNPLCQRPDPSEPIVAEVITTPARCAATDPNCGPMSFRDICLDQAGYDAHARRIPQPLPDYWTPAHEYLCSHDGECIASGCGYACISLTVAGNVGFTCEGHPDLDEALADHFCGCVDGLCRWFRQ
jgi:hypothetical protein